MRQAKLTLEGMRQGVRDSDVFLLVLTLHVLASWFCKFVAALLSLPFAAFR